MQEENQKLVDQSVKTVNSLTAWVNYLENQAAHGTRWFKKKPEIPTP